MRVVRYCEAGSEPGRPGPDFVRVEDCGGNVILDFRCGPDGPMSPESAEAAKARPWFYTGSPFGQEILDLAKSRGLPTNTG